MRGWKRFRPRRAAQTHVQVVATAESIYEAAQHELNAALGRRRVHFEHLEAAIQLMSDQVELLTTSGAPRDVQASANLALLLLQAPRAARAQAQMDKHHGGYKNREARLYELIDFNDAFVATVLALPNEYRPHFLPRLRLDIDALCQRVGAKTFTDRQFEAITYGLSREIAVYLGAIKEGYTAYMTGRSTDAMGVDMVIIHPETRRSLNIDCKTRSSYHFRLLDLVREGRLSEAERVHAEEVGFCHVVNGHGQEAVHTTLLRIATEELGAIENFSFVDTGVFARRLRKAMGL